MKRFVWLSGLVMLIVAAWAAEPQETPEYLFQKALYLETAKADYQGAIPIYEKIAKDYESNAVFVVKALLQMGICYEKTGNLEKADECAGKFTSLLMHSPEASAAFEEDVGKESYIKDFLMRHVSGIIPPAYTDDVDNLRRKGTKELWQNMLNSAVIDVDFKEANFQEVINTLSSKIAEAEIGSMGKDGKGISCGMTLGIPMIISSRKIIFEGLEDNQSSNKIANEKIQKTMVQESPPFQEWKNLPKITLSLQKVSAAEVIRRVTEMTGVKYRIEDAGVVFELPSRKVSELQDKVDRAKSGDTIVVKAGEYSGCLTITKPLTLIGEAADKVVICDGGEYGIKVMSDDVTIENLNMRQCRFGILVRSHKNMWQNLAKTRNVRIRNVQINDCVFGIYTLKTENLAIERCTLNDIACDGIWVSWDAENTSISGNTLKNIGDQGIWLGPYPNHPDTCAKNGIIVSNVVDTVRESGILFAGENCEIKNNLICNVKGDGYSVGAISLTGSLVKNMEISRNIIRNNQTDGIGIKTDKKENCSGVVIKENNIYENGNLGLENSTEASIDARNNWWGSADGPRDVDKNPQGTGNGISGKVLYDPWEKTPLALSENVSGVPKVFSADKEDAPTAAELIKLAPRISLAEENITTFDVKGTLDSNGTQLRFIVSGKKPDQLALQILDPRDGTPIMINAGNSFMFYDPLSSEVVIGRAVPMFTLSLKKTSENAGESDSDGQGFMLSFGLCTEGDKKKENEETSTVIDINSLLTQVKPLEVRTEDKQCFVVNGRTKKGGRVTAYIAPSRKEGPYTRVELYGAGEDRAFLVLDEIIINQPVPAGRFTLPEKRLLESGLLIKQLSDDLSIIKKVGFIYRAIQAIMARLALASEDPVFRSTVEKMSIHKIDWEKMKIEDKKIAPILKSLFTGDEPESKELPGKE